MMYTKYSKQGSGSSSATDKCFFSQQKIYSIPCVQMCILYVLLLFGLALHCSDVAALLVPSAEHPANCIESERTALLDFKNNIIDPRNSLSSWVGQACCSWDGVRCDNATGNIIGLALGVFSLQAGEISPSLLALQRLNYLDLSVNDFSGTSIPSFISQFKDLRYLNLAGAGFGGPIPAGLRNLSSLQTLDLSYNNLLISQPADSEWLSHLSSLQHLRMNGVNLSSVSSSLFLALNKLPSINAIRLSGAQLQSLPVSIPHLNFSSLSVLDLSSNRIDVSVSPWVFHLKSLEYLDLSQNKLLSSYNSNAVMAESIGGLCNLKTLDLSYLNMSMRLAELNFTGCPKDSLTHLQLASANLDGDIPDWIGHIKNLKFLDLAENRLRGSITEALFPKLEKLNTLRLSYNSLVFNVSSDWIPPFLLQELSIRSCSVGPEFPAWLQTQHKLNVLDISNTGISGTIPDWFWNLTSLNLVDMSISDNEIEGMLPKFSTSIQWNTIDLSSNRFYGPLPGFLGSSISRIYLSNNSFSGSISHMIAENILAMSHNRFFTLDLSMNKLNGSVPSSLCQMELQSLRLFKNNLSGELPNCWWNSSSLSEFDLSSNMLTGGIPDSLSHHSQLRQLRLSHNKLSGEIPDSLKNCGQLAVLDLSYNNLTGNIPVWLGQSLSSLLLLILKSNAFVDHIPKEISQLKYLQILDLSYNNLSGSIPESFGNLSAMQTLWKSVFSMGGILGVGDTIPVTSKGKEEEYSEHLLPFVKIIDLSNNGLTGDIPEELASLYGLQSLDLSANQLEGEIPRKLGRLQLLESLDLSRNKLFGNIPSTFTNMTSLSDFNVSYNNLSGQIPSGNQFSTFRDPSIYVGNHLCGFPLSDDCTKDGGAIQKEPPSDHEDEEENEMLWIYIGSLSGFAVGFWTVWGVLMFKKKWRYAYFRCTDTTCDKICLFCSQVCKDEEQDHVKLLDLSIICIIF